MCLPVLVTLLARLCLSSYRYGQEPVLPFPEVQTTLFSHPAPHCTLGLTKYHRTKGKECTPILGLISPDSLGAGWLTAISSGSTLFSEVT